MNVISAIYRRELRAYFATPVAYVFIIVFLMLTGFCCFSLQPGFVAGFYLGGFFERGRADMQSFFSGMPLLFVVLVPAISMRLWSEERRSGTIEQLMTLPVSMGQAVLGKFLAAWTFTAIALACTLPAWITVNYLGDPDNGVIVSSYLGSLLMAGAFLALGSALSALTNNQVIAFVIAVVACLAVTLSATRDGVELLSVVLPQGAVDVVVYLSFKTHFDAVVRGVIDLRDVLFFLSVIALGLFANAVIIERTKAN
jgi:ABC-2 type transport system permease protein